MDPTKCGIETPQKTNEPSRTQRPKYLDKYHEMVELFDSMICSLRLLKLCKKSPTFHNVSAQVEKLAKREFSIKNLAQMKFILADGIQIDKILVHDKKSLCMKQDLNISLIFDIVEGHSQHSDFIALSQVFASKLINFFTLQPEAVDIPVSPLPKPFSQGSWNVSANKDTEVSDMLESVYESHGTWENNEMVITSSLLPPSFSIYFSTDAERVQPLPSSINDSLNNQNGTQVVENLNGSVTDRNVISEEQINLPDTCLSAIQTPCSQLKEVECESPQHKLSLSKASLTIETPAQVTPKRSIPTCESRPIAPINRKYTDSYKPSKRVLDFPRMDNNMNPLHSFGAGTQNYTVLQCGDAQSLDEDFKGSSLEQPNGRLDNFGLDLTMKEPCSVDNRVISAGLPNLVALIQQIFQNLNYSLITKKELVHKIIINNMDIVETSEVEEQIKILEKLVPDWISKKVVSSGDTMYQINTASDLVSVQERIKSNA